MRKSFWYWFICWLSLGGCFLLHPAIAQGEDVYEDKAQALEAQKVELEGQPGSYLVKIAYRFNDEIIEESVYVTITSDNTAVLGHLAINAYPAAVAKDQVTQLSMQEWIALTDAKAWNMETGEAISITQVDTSQLQANLGTYPVTFSTVNQLKTTVNVDVVNDKMTQNNINAYYRNHSLAAFETAYAKEGLSWTAFENNYLVSLQFVLLGLLALPIFALIAQYILTKKLVQQVVKLLMD